MLIEKINCQRLAYSYYQSCVSSLTFAQVPSAINYQGYLTDDSGSPIDDIVNVTFFILLSTRRLCAALD